MVGFRGSGVALTGVGPSARFLVCTADGTSGDGSGRRVSYGSSSCCSTLSGGAF